MNLESTQGTTFMSLILSSSILRRVGRTAVERTWKLESFKDTESALTWSVERFWKILLKQACINTSKTIQPRVGTSYITHYIVPDSYTETEKKRKEKRKEEWTEGGGGGRGFCRKGAVGFSAWGTVRIKRIFWNFYHPLCEFLWSVAPIQVRLQVNLGSLDWMA